MKNIGLLSRVDHRSVPSDSVERTHRLGPENPATTWPPPIAGDDANRRSPWISSSQALRAVGLIERDQVGARRSVALDGRDHEVVETASDVVRNPPASTVQRMLAGGDVDRVDVPRVVADERGVAVDRDAGAADRVELDGGVPHRLPRVEVDRGEVGIERTASSDPRPAMGSATRSPRRGRGARPGGPSPNPSV